MNVIRKLVGFEIPLHRSCVNRARATFGTGWTELLCYHYEVPKRD